MLSSVASPSTTTLLSFPSTHKYAKLHKPLVKLHSPILHKPFTSSSLILTKTRSSTTSSQSVTHPEDSSDDDWEHEEFEELEDGDEYDCPWEGAVVYKRDASTLHLEYCTTLERLGLGKLSSNESKIRASELGLRIVKSVKEFPDGTPVLISIDVSRRKQSLRLDGIVRTVLALNCHRCGVPAAQSIYSDFSLLLCEEPIEEPDTIDSAFFGDINSSSLGTDEAENDDDDDDDDDDGWMDPEDQLYFPPNEKIIDISKNIRDLIHLEITADALCDLNCKGMCLMCGTNHNVSKCSCEKNEVPEKSYPMRNLRKQMQQK